LVSSALLLILVDALIFVLVGIISVIVFVFIFVLVVINFVLFVGVGLSGSLTTTTHGGHCVGERGAAKQTTRHAAVVFDGGSVTPQHHAPVGEL
jgi:hypothetical protein